MEYAIQLCICLSLSSFIWSVVLRGKRISQCDRNVKIRVVLRSYFAAVLILVCAIVCFSMYALLSTAALPRATVLGRSHDPSGSCVPATPCLAQL